MPETVLFNGVRVEIAPPLPAVEVAPPVTTVEVEPPTPRVKVQRPVPLVGVPVTTPDPSVLVAPMRGPAGPEGPEGPQGPAGSGGGAEINDAVVALDSTWSSSKIDGELDGKAPTSHTHAQSDVTGLDTTLAGKSDTAHTHDYAPTVHDHDGRYYTEAEVDTALAGKAASSHGHAIGDVTNLQTTLDGKAASTHTHAAADTTTGTFDAARLPVAASGESSATKVVRADDARLSDARTPTSHTHTRAQITDAGTAIAYNVNPTGDAAAGEVVLGSDTRLTNARAWRLLGSATYAPATLAITSTTSTGFVDVDATNLAVTFTAPASGAVDVRLEGMSDMQTGGHIGSWNLRSGSADVAGTARAMTRTNFSITLQTTIRVTGLTPGASYTYKWGYRTNNAAGYHRFLHGGEYGTSVMEVRAA